MTEEHTTVTASIDYDQLMEFITAIDGVVDECVLEFTDEGISTRAIDYAHVAVIEAELLAEQCDEYSGVNEWQFGLDVSGLRAVLDAWKTQDSVTIKLNPFENVLTFRSDPHYYHHEETDVSDDREPDDFGFEWKTSVSMQSDAFKSSVEFLNEIANKVKLGYDTASDVFYTEAYDLEEPSGMSIPQDELADVDAEDAQCEMSLDYLSLFAEAIPDGRVITIDMKTEWPMRISYDIGAGGVTYMQAPRLSDND